MTIFRSRGFDSLIGAGTQFIGSLHIASGSTMQVDGSAICNSIVGSIADGKVNAKTTLRVGGDVIPQGPTGLEIVVHNVIISGKVTCNEIRVEGALAVRSGAHLKADKIYYRELIIETGAVVHGQMFHLDHVSQQEQVQG